MGAITLPEKVSGSTITSVDCNLGTGVTKIVIPGSIKTVYRLAENDTNLLEVVVCNGVEKLGVDDSIWTYATFRGCTSLSKVTLPGSLKVIGDYCFKGCTALTSIALPGALTDIGDYAFADSGLTEVTVPASVTKVKNAAFRNTAVKKVTINSTVTGYDMFSGCKKLTTVTLGGNLKALAPYAFQNCTALKAITLPENVTELGSYTFAGCAALETIAMPIKGTSIGSSYTFSGCASLKKFNIPYGVQVVPESCFADCAKLEGIYFPQTVKTVSSNAFKNCASMKTVRYQGAEDDWGKISKSSTNNSYLTAAYLEAPATPFSIA